VNPNRFRCQACRTRRTSFTSLIKHQRDKGHLLCNCGGYHFAHRPVSPLCEQNPMSDLRIAMRGSGVTDAELEEIEMHCVWEKPGRPFTVWRD
jgi:transcription elongation factor Elf1